MKQILKKWIDLASRTKMKNNKLKHSQKVTTGHNHPVKKNLLLTPLEGKVINIIGEVTVAGVAVGFDTLDNDEGPRHASVLIDQGTDGVNDLASNDGMYVFSEETQAHDEEEDEVHDVHSASNTVTTKKRKSLGSVQTTKRQASEENGKTDELIMVEKEKADIMREQLQVAKKRHC